MPRGRSVSDRTISTLAVVKVLFDQEQSFLSYIEPFLEHCMHKSQQDEISVLDLQSEIYSTFGLKLPQAVIKTLLRRQEKKGHVFVRRNICLIERKRLGDVDLEPVRQAARREQGALTQELIKFALDRFGKGWSPERAQDQLLLYVEQFSARVFQATQGREGMLAIDKDSAQDQHVVHSFVLYALKEDPDSFSFLTSLVKGKMLAEAIYLEEAEIQDGVEPLTNLEVYLDTPILMRALGFMGEELVAPYLELLELLERQGALVRCFQTNVEEAERILAQVAKATELQDGDRASRDVYKHFARIGATPSDIAVRSRRLSTDLLRLKIQPVELPQARPRHAIDQEALSKVLKRQMPKYRPRTLATDVAALAAVHGLRDGVSARTLPKSKAIFVTRNYSLYKVSAEFFKQRDPDEEIPPCVPMSAFTTMVWVREPLAAPELPKHRVVADACAAMRPGTELWHAFDAEIDKLREEEDISADLAHHLRVDYESEQALMDKTFGDESEYVEGTAKQVAERALEDVRFTAERRQANVEARGARIGRRTARILFAVVIPLLGIGAIFGTLGVFNNVSSPLPDVLQWPGTILFASISIFSFVDGISFRSRVQRTACRFEAVSIKLAKRLHGIR
jgi:hypothetical protein